MSCVGGGGEGGEDLGDVEGHFFGVFSFFLSFRGLLSSRVLSGREQGGFLSGFRSVMLRPFFSLLLLLLLGLAGCLFLACLPLQYYRYRDRCSPKTIYSFFIGYICQSCIQDQIFVASLLSSLVGSLVYGSFRIRICLIYLSDGSYCLLLLLGSVVLEMANK